MDVRCEEGGDRGGGDDAIYARQGASGETRILSVVGDGEKEGCLGSGKRRSWWQNSLYSLACGLVAHVESQTVDPSENVVHSSLPLLF